MVNTSDPLGCQRVTPRTGGVAIEDAGPPVAVSKLVPGGAPRTLVPRDQPVAALYRLVEEHPVTLVAAPAGARARQC